MSETRKHESLIEALVAFEAEAPVFTKSREAKTGSYTYRYADLGDILPVTLPLLAKHGLAWTSSITAGDDGSLWLSYRLVHESGEADAAMMPLGVSVGCRPQELGSAVTYARRYAFTAQLNLVAQDDDDGQAAQHADRTAAGAQGHPSSPSPAATPVRPSERPASAKQRGLLNGRAAEAGLSSVEMANALLRAADQPERSFDSQEHAQQFVHRQLDRLPARLVDRVLEEIGRAGARGDGGTIGEPEPVAASPDAEEIPF